MTKTYSSKANANRAAKTLIAKLPDCVVVSAPFKSVNGTTWELELTSTEAEVQLSPETRKLIADFVVVYPTPPKTSEPLIERKPMKPYAQWDLSECETPCAVAAEIFYSYHKLGRADERKEILRVMMEEGVQRNTAHTQYRRLRIQAGLPGAVGSAK